MQLSAAIRRARAQRGQASNSQGVLFLQLERVRASAAPLVVGLTPKAGYATPSPLFCFSQGLERFELTRPFVDTPLHSQAHVETA